MWTVLTALVVLANVRHGLAQCDNFRLASYYDSAMVLQKAPASAAIWGYANNAGDLIAVDFDGGQQDITAYIGEEGVPVWAVSMPPTVAGGPYDISFTSDECTIGIDDVLFGDVFICSGQSNMEFFLEWIDDPEDDLQDVVNYPDVRTFHGAKVISDEHLYDLEGVTRTWARPTPENMASFSAVCWLFGRNLNIQLGYPIGLVETCWDGSTIETWSSPEALYQCFGEEGPPDPPVVTPSDASELWNAMLHPYLPMSIFGVVWYQGESNFNRSHDYICSLPAMIDDWRVKWHDKTAGQTDQLFPFGQVQLAPYRDRDDMDTGYPDLRWAQTLNMGYTPHDDLAQVYTAVAADLPDFASPIGRIHPRYKRQISYRLSLGAFAVAYGLGETTGRFQGPFPTDIYTENVSGQVVIEYDNLETELDDLRTADGFELCCSSDEDTTCPGNGASWQLAPITGSNFSTVTVDDVCESGRHITGIRYIWRESPCDLEACAVYSVENDLPAPPFVYHGALKQV